MELPNITGKNVLIIGPPASGKTYIADKIKTGEHRIIHTDDYMKYGYKDALYMCLAGILSYRGKTIVEGVQGYRLLRKGIQTGQYYPDVVIELLEDPLVVRNIYHRERDPKKLKYLKSFNKMHQTILKEYHQMKNPHLPEWHKIQNNYLG